jgi:hypothetical protein
MEPTTPPSVAATPQVMLLSVWLDTMAGWHARVVTPDARAHEFTSPFDLAQFLSRRLQPQPRPGRGSLR